MKWFLVLALVPLALARPDGQYDSKFDNIDVDEVTANVRLLKSYALCFLDKGKCSSEANEIKKLLPEATRSSCGKCSEKQKVIAAKSIKAVREKLPVEYTLLIKQNDPENESQAELQNFIGKYAP